MPCRGPVAQHDRRRAAGDRGAGRDAPHARRRPAGFTIGPQLTAEIRDAGLRFGPAVAPADRALVLREIATARPEAQRLIGIVDGLVTV